MRVEKLEKMVKGWFIGNFTPTSFKTEVVEVAIKEYKAGDHEKSHCHKIATEITTIISGKVMMNENQYDEGDIIIIEPLESTDFTAITNAITTVVKIPGALNDKYTVIKRN